MNPLTVILWAYLLAVTEIFWRNSPLALGDSNTGPALLLILMVELSGAPAFAVHLLGAALVYICFLGLIFC